MNMELVDGFEDLPEPAQEKVKRALEQGHVDDEDWNGVSKKICNPLFEPYANRAKRIKSATGSIPLTRTRVCF